MKDTKILILEKSLELFSNRNYDSVSISEICAATGLTKGAIYHHFEGKNAIYIAVIDYMVDRILSKIECDCTPLGFMEFVESGFAFLESFEGSDVQPTNVSFPMKCVFMFHEAHRLYPNFDVVGNRVHQAHINLWTRVIDHSIQIGEIAADIDVDCMGRICQSISAAVFPKTLLKYPKDQIINELRHQYMALYSLMKVKK